MCERVDWNCLISVAHSTPERISDKSDSSINESINQSISFIDERVKALCRSDDVTKRLTYSYFTVQKVD